MSLLRKVGLVAAVGIAGTAVGAGTTNAAVDLYGALAVSQSSGTVASAINHNSVGAADKAAVEQCRKSDCRVVVHFANACGAVAQGADHRFGWAWGPTRVEAERDAVAMLGLSAPPFPDLGSAIPRPARIVRSECTDNAR